MKCCVCNRVRSVETNCPKPATQMQLKGSRGYSCRRLTGQAHGHCGDVGGVHAVNHGAGNQDGGPTLFGGFVNDVHRTQLHGTGLLGVNFGGLDKLAGNLCLGRAQDDACLFFPARPGLGATWRLARPQESRHREFQRHSR